MRCANPQMKEYIFLADNLTENKEEKYAGNQFTIKIRGNNKSLLAKGFRFGKNVKSLTDKPDKAILKY